MAICIFSKGEHIVYASNGICIIEDVKRMSFVKGEPEKLYYILRPQSDKNSTIYIPEDNSMLISRMRLPVNADEIETIVTKARKSNVKWIEDRKQRSTHYRELLSDPHPSALLPLLKTISQKHTELTETGKKLSAADKETFESAMRFIKDEFTLSLGNDTQKACEYIESAIGPIAHIT